jgi:aspartyl/asparaginyl-tRNA synthetase
MMMMSTVSSSTAQRAIIPRIKTADATTVTDHAVIVKGWVRTVRKQKTLAFVEVNDGSNLSGIQCVLQFDQMDEHTMNGEFCYCCCCCVK